MPLSKILIGLLWKVGMPPIHETISGLDVIKVPGKSKTTVVMFHGYGGSPKDLYPIHQLNPDLTWIFPQGPLKVPISLLHSGRAWFPIDIESMQKAVATNDSKAFENAFPEQTNKARAQIQALLDELAISSEYCVLGGFSQGAVVATDMVLRSKKNMAGLLILSGTLVNEQSWCTLVKEKRGMKFFQTHGLNDPLLPFKLAQKLETILKGGGFEGSLFGFSGGHEVTPDCLEHIHRFLNDVNSLRKL